MRSAMTGVKKDLTGTPVRCNAGFSQPVTRHLDGCGPGRKEKAVEYDEAFIEAGGAGTRA